jgi:hypothetical protein
MLLDLGALVLEMHRHGRFLPDSLQRRAAEAVGTDAELRSLSRSLEAGDGAPDLVAAGIAGNCDRCGALYSTGAGFCSQCGNELDASALPRKATLGADPELAGAAPVPRRTVAAPPQATVSASAPAAASSPEQTQVLEPPPDAEAEAEPEPDLPETPPPGGDGPPPPPPPAARRARATRVRQRLDEPARPRAPLPTGLLAGIGAGIVVIVLAVVVLSSGGGDDDEPERAAQTPGQREPEPPPPDEAPAPGADDTPTPGGALEPVESVTADDYDPSGDNQEHGEEADLAVDGDAATSWPTEEYDTGSLQKDGVGLALAPAEAVPARGLDIETTTPGFDVTIYGAEAPALPTSIASGWTEVASEESLERKGRIDLDTAGRDFSHYLIWITTIPEEEGKVEISEARLLR